MISKRLEHIVDWVDGSCLADIGCDHAYVAIECIQRNKVQKAYACDVAQGPLQHAKDTISQYHLENQIECLLKNGIQDLPEDVDVIVIAGMGASTIQMILDQGEVKENQTLILSPHNRDDELRSYLQSHHYKIEKEQIVYDEGHFYPIMMVHFNQEQTLTIDEVLYGKNCVVNEDYQLYIQTLKKKYNTLLKQIPKGKDKEILHRLEILNKKDTL